jgi:hypothetical protein
MDLHRDRGSQSFLVPPTLEIQGRVSVTHRVTIATVPFRFRN